MKNNNHLGPERFVYFSGIYVEFSYEYIQFPKFPDAKHGLHCQHYWLMEVDRS